MAKKTKGYWVETIDGRTIFMAEADGWEILQDGLVLQFHENSSEECIIATLVLRNVIQWYYGEMR